VIAFAVYVVTVLAAASGVCGHPPLLPRLARQAWARLGPGEAHGATCAPAGAPHSPSAVSRDAPGAPEASQAPSRPSPTWSQP
jgi:hypothetical protein